MSTSSSGSPSAVVRPLATPTASTTGTSRSSSARSSRYSRRRQPAGQLLQGVEVGAVGHEPDHVARDAPDRRHEAVGVPLGERLLPGEVDERRVAGPGGEAEAHGEMFTPDPASCRAPRPTARARRRRRARARSGGRGAARATRTPAGRSPRRGRRPRAGWPIHSPTTGKPAVGQCRVLVGERRQHDHDEQGRAEGQHHEGVERWRSTRRPAARRCAPRPAGAGRPRTACAVAMAALAISRSRPSVSPMPPRSAASSMARTGAMMTSQSTMA